MVDISKMPTGSKFRVGGASGLRKKLGGATRYGAKNIHPHVDDIVDVVSGYGSSIKKGKFSRTQQISAKKKILSKIREETGRKISTKTREDVKKILKGLSAKEAARANKKNVLATSKGKAEIEKLPWAQRQKAKKAIKVKQALNVKYGRMSMEQQEEEEEEYIATSGAARKTDKTSQSGIVGSTQKGGFINSQPGSGSLFAQSRPDNVVSINKARSFSSIKKSITGFAGDMSSKAPSGTPPASRPPTSSPPIGLKKVA